MQLMLFHQSNLASPNNSAFMLMIFTWDDWYLNSEVSPQPQLSIQAIRACLGTVITMEFLQSKKTHGLFVIGARKEEAKILKVA